MQIAYFDLHVNPRVYYRYQHIKSIYNEDGGEYLEQWFSKCGTRTTSGTWASSSGTQRNLRIKYKSGRVSTKAIFFYCFKWERLFHAEHSGVFFLAPRI